MLHIRVCQQVVVAWCLLVLVACDGGGPPVKSSLPVLVVQAKSAHAASVHTYPGEIRAHEEAALSFQVSGKLLRREVDAGQRVRQGERLAQLDLADFTLQVKAARAQYAAAEADLVRARDELARYRILAEQQLVSRSLLDAQASALKAAQSQADAARANLDVARNQAKYAELIAPADGVIASRLVEAGQVVSAGQPIYILAGDGGREVAIALPESEITNFSVGQVVAVELWNQPGQRWQGVLCEIAAAADPLTRTWAARVSLPPETRDLLELGQSARVLIGQQAKAALHVPLTAIQPADTAQRARVWVLDPISQTVRAREVIPGTYGSQTVPILDGLERDDWIVAAGGHLLHEGQQVLALDRQHRPISGP